MRIFAKNSVFVGKKAERGGLNPATFCKVIKNLYLTLNSNNDKDLESLVCLLLKHDFLLS